MACSACTKRRQQQVSRSNTTATRTASTATTTAAKQGATLRDKLRFTGR